MILLGNPDTARILVIGCDPTVKQGKVNSPFGIKKIKGTNKYHYRNKYFSGIFRNLSSIQGMCADGRTSLSYDDETSDGTQDYMNNNVIITNAVNEEVISECGNKRVKLETSQSLPLGKVSESIWYYYFTKENENGKSWREQLIELAIKENIERIYITSERLIKPLLKDEYWSEANKLRTAIRKSIEYDKDAKESYIHITILGKMTIFDKDIRPLYRHYKYIICID